MQIYAKKYSDDVKGKMLMRLIKDELENQDCSFEDVTSKIVEYIVEHEDMRPLINRIERVFSN